MHPLQAELASRIAAADVAAKRLDEVQTRKREVEARVVSLAEATATTRAALADVAGAHADGAIDAKMVERARKAFSDAESEHELAEIELEGIAPRVAQAEREHASKRRDLGLAVVDVCRAAVLDIEESARAAFARFAEIMVHRHALAKCAARFATEAAGHVSEPIYYSNETAGQLRRDQFDEGFAGVLRKLGLSPSFAPTGNIAPATLADLLALAMPMEAAAAE